MSYEGYEEYLCENGHYTTVQCYDFADCSNCSCGAKFVCQHSVDQTNGYDEEDDSTFAAAKVEIGWDDVTNQDHYGNIYYTKWMKYAPAKDSPWI